MYAYYTNAQGQGIKKEIKQIAVIAPNFAYTRNPTVERIKKILRSKRKNEHLMISDRGTLFTLDSAAFFHEITLIVVNDQIIYNRFEPLQNAPQIAIDYLLNSKIA